jgi:hypothetical protein
MDNTECCQVVWQELINAAKLRLFDAKDKEESRVPHSFASFCE